MRMRDLPRLLFILPIRIYRAVISPMLPASCIYTPTCSAYAQAVILRHGILRGSILAGARIGRCVGGLYHGGEDPPPDVFSFAVVAHGYRVHRRRRRLRDQPPRDTMGPDEGSR